MGKRPKYKMSVAERAKQFMPFSALTGFEEAIKKVEDEYYKNMPVIISETEKENLDKNLAKISKGEDITIRYYNGTSYEYLTGKLNGIDEIKKCLIIGLERISIKDIIEIKKEEEDYA